MRSTSGTIPENYQEIVPQQDRSYDGFDTDYDMQPDAYAGVEHLDPTLTNLRSSKYDLRHNRKPNSNDDYRNWLRPTIAYRAHTYNFRKS